MAETLGRRLLAASGPDGWLAVESEIETDSAVSAADPLLARLLAESFSGSELLTISQGRHMESAVRLSKLTVDEQALLVDRYALDRQQARGAWYIPAAVKLSAGMCSLPAALANDGRYAFVTTAEDTITVPTHAAADHVFLWSTLLPLLERILAPVILRSGLPGAPKPSDQLAAWQTADAYNAALGVDGGAAYDAMRYGGEWGHLDRAQRQETRIELVKHLASQMTEAVAARHRAVVLAEMVAAFYSKTKKDTPLARRVLAKSLQPALSGYFAGDWLAFLSYLGEQPNPSEEIFTALPEPRLYVPGTSRVKDIAAQQGIEENRVAAVLASFSGQPSVLSPIDERLGVIRNWWKAYDAAHTRQTPRMPALWGLLGDGGVGLSWDGNLGWQPVPRLYAKVLPERVLEDVDRLWRRTTLPRWPERLIVQPHPHLALTAAVGPALKFWDGLALTVWYATEGPVSRTPIDNLQSYHAREIAALEAAGTPVDREVFAELREAEGHLGLEEEVRVKDARRIGVAASLGENGQAASFITVDDVRNRRNGFESLRDIVTRYRRAWAKDHLEDYLRFSWEGALTELSKAHHQALAARGKPMTAKQFAAKAAPTANSWFGGRLDLVYAAIGEKAGHGQVDVGPDLPCDIQDLSQYVFHLIGGQLDADWRQEDWLVRSLGTKTGKYVQLTAARGKPATLKDLNLGGDPAHEGQLLDLWPRFQIAVRQALDTDALTIRRVLTPSAESDTQRGQAPVAAEPRVVQAKPPAVPAPVDDSQPGVETVSKRPGLLTRLFRSRR